MGGGGREGEEEKDAVPGCLKAGRLRTRVGYGPVNADASLVSVTFEKPKLYRFSV
jgi:hypothetical protein